MPSENKGVATCIIKVDGETRITGEQGGASQGPESTWFLESAQVDRRIDAPDMFTFDLAMRTGADLQFLDDLREGRSIEILMGQVGREQAVFRGEIHYIEPHFRFQGGSTVTVGGYDRSHRLTRGTRSRTWGDGVQAQDLYPSVVRDVISQSQDSSGILDGLSPARVDGPGTRSEYLPQLNASDYQFMQWMGSGAARRVDADNPNDDSKVRFTPLETSGDAVKILTREATSGEGETPIHEADFSLSTVRQVAKVEVRSWDPRRKMAIVGTATASDYGFDGTPGWEATGEALYGRRSAGKVLTIVDRPVDSKEEADALARSIFNQLSMDFVTGEVDFEGDPAVSAGALVELKGFGQRFDGKYLVTQCTHSMAPRNQGFTTRLRLARNAVGG